MENCFGDIMHHSIEPHELGKVDLACFQIVQVSDGTNTVVLWEAPDPEASMPLHMQAATLTIRLCDPLNPVRRKDVCERLQAHLAASRRANKSAARQRTHAHRSGTAQHRV
ncbi:hypothetical protein [Caballeronia grimmiae]|uniref:Uncharacterized protein n=1 Tax=Caballeronia grimmiae TaxID=1071679 RepID=A0A069ND41_9BURK|nr:hypothetical protein [Caballeronia grimmiae]KDR26027.1 hypothetical protein BG57_28490 [Caballeronia grimmiae]GGD93600.1 hypothetical protein GCM10010985_55400 [Caballeronia grimmiae]